MTDNIEWKSLDVTMAEGTTLRVGSFRASDGEVVSFSPEVIKKIFSKVDKPIPMYDTHKGAGTSQTRKVFGHAVKLGLETTGDHMCYKALMMDPSFKLTYASGGDDTSAEIDPIRDEAGNIIDGTLTGIAVVPNPAISGTQMKVAAIAFEAPKIVPSGGGIAMTKGIQKTLLEAGVPADKIEGLVETIRGDMTKEFESAGLQKKLDAANEQVKLACSERDEMKKKFEQAQTELDGIYGTQVTALINDVKGLKFENPEALVEGMPHGTAIKTLSTLKAGLLKNIPAAAPVGSPRMDPAAAPGAQQPATFEAMLNDMGVAGLWAETHKTPEVR